MAHGKSVVDFVLGTSGCPDNKVALVQADTEEKWTFGQIKALVRSVQSALTRRGAKKGDVVAICARNTVEHMVLLLAVPSIGAIVTGINPVYTAGEIKHQCESSSAKYLVMMPDDMKKVREVQRACPWIREVFMIGEAAGYTSVRALMEEDGTATREVYIDPEDVAYLYYSSGTTGLPKGVMLTHGALHAGLDFQRRVPSMAMNQADKDVVNVFPYFHIGGLFTCLQALHVGCTTFFIPIFDFKVFLRTIEKYRVGSILVPPSLLVRLAKDPMVDQHDLTSLSTILVGSAPTRKELEQEIKTRVGLNITLIRQGYGMTEVGITHLSPLNEPSVPGSAGKVHPMMQCKIVDTDTGATCGTGQSGEVWIKTAGVMRGYLNNPRATADMIDRDDWLHTGDIGYNDKDGNLFIVDRLKELIKYKGFQVAPAELEALLLTHPDVADIGVIGVPDERAGEVPRAYVVQQAGKTVRPGDLERYVSERVSDYKRLRGGVKFVEAIPRNPTGKILRRVLRKMHEGDLKAKL